MRENKGVLSTSRRQDITTGPMKAPPCRRARGGGLRHGWTGELVATDRYAARKSELLFGCYRLIGRRDFLTASTSLRTS